MKSNNSKKTIYIVTKKYVLLFLLIFISVILFFLEHFTETPISIADIQTKEIFNAKKSSVGYFAPSFKLRNIKGNYESLESYRGEVVVLNFWATWCAPCRIEMPSFEKLYRRYRSEGVTVLAITLDKNSENKIKSFVDEYGLSFPILLDEKGEVERLYPSMTIPFTYIIDRQGRIVARVDGAKNWESSETFEAIEYLLKNRN
ncbi:MAG: TlpA disulfide reductase family protein [Nitrospinaceae bacterium]|nr:TlpA family protein disulfide reductase [Nitrospina sp.]MBT4260758.1 TlpA family protein disulfide reductase [Nitrospina sp.]MBT5967748.1 TlpA family protein disulfide reductase [Nitrospina sp.]MBT7272239.1 TlpA family protein disulfide reductase [Nitrospina sp.]MDG1843717.1 TlpA disulfide reductase family protein [Nitrospinaceae bacterium]|tara:strand:+ start:203 stop:808 length:606 start_codon:yes stop_codon:yes gene_type:complete